MYENITYEYILQRMLDRIPDSMDKREGSIIFDALAPAAVELQLMYIEFDVILKETFADTASREYLIRRVAERGIIPEPATKAILKGKFTPPTLNIPIGSRFSCGTLNYVITEKTADGEYKLQCETFGEIGNSKFGQMIPIEYIEGLVTAELTEILIPGEDEEETEDLRTRYFDSLNAVAFGGNIADYKAKTNAINGVGATKVTPIWNGGGTVLLTIINSDWGKASNTLIEYVKEIIDPTTNSGEGWGLAPIGHTVTVKSVEAVKVFIVTDITFDKAYSWDNLQNDIDKVIENYLLELRKQWADKDNTIIRISQIESRLLDVDGVVDIKDTRINNLVENLILGVYEIPVMGGVSNG